MAGGGLDPDELGTLSEINITPFVDVVLVLLVIFMITAPMIMKDVIGLNLPKAKSSTVKAKSTLGIAISKNGDFLLNGETLSLEKIRLHAESAFLEDEKVQAIISADKDSTHRFLVQIIDLVKQVGIEDFAIQVEKVESATSK